MADIASLKEVIEELKIESASNAGQQITFLDAIALDMSKLVETSSSMIEELRAIREALAPDNGLERAQQAERESEAKGNAVVAQAKTAPAVQPAEKSGFNWKLALGAAAIAGIAGIAASLAGFLDFDADGVKRKVKTLLSIKDDVGGNLDFFLDGGTFLLAMTGIGLGLAVFGAGSAIAGLGSALANFASPTWAEDLKQNVLTLMSIKDEMGGNLDMILNGGAFLLAMTGVALGLAVFGAGSAVAGLAGAINNFSDASWAQKIKDNVLTLMSIKDELGGSLDMLMSGGAFVLAMTGIGLGLAVFGAGSTIAGLGGALSNFADASWAERIKQNVITLLSIKDEVGGNLNMLMDGGAFVLAMAGLAAGIAIFGGAGAIAGLSEGLNKLVGNEDFAGTIKRQVTTLLSIGDNADPEKAERMKTALFTVSEAIGRFASAKWGDALSAVGTSILNFFTGNGSPIDEFMKVADNSKKLSEGAIALETITHALERISGLRFDGSKLGLKEMGEDLLASVPLIESAIMGGTAPGGFFGRDVTFKGLASGDIKYDDAVKNLEKLKLAIAPVQSSGQVLQNVQNQNNDVKSSKSVVAPTVNQVVSPTTVNNASSSNIAVRNNHRPDNAKLYAIN